MKDTPALPPDSPASWTELSFDEMAQIDRETIEAAQLAALKLRFEQFRDSIPALKAMTDKQDVDDIDSLTAALPLNFDHRVYKAYPLTLLEKRKFGPLTKMARPSDHPRLE